MIYTVLLTYVKKDPEKDGGLASKPLEWPGVQGSSSYFWDVTLSHFTGSHAGGEGIGHEP